MEARLLYPSGRRTPAVSPLLGSVVPALLPRMSRVELEMLGAMRGPVSPTVLPAGAPPDLLVSQVRVRANLVRFYLDLMPGLDRMHRNGVDALCDVATVLHLERWIQPAVATETMRPLRQLVGPEEELGFGPAYDEVLDVLHGIADFTGSARRVQAVTQAWIERPEVYWDGIADAFLATASITGRQSVAADGHPGHRGLQRDRPAQPGLPGHPPARRRRDPRRRRRRGPGASPPASRGRRHLRRPDAGLGS